MSKIVVNGAKLKCSLGSSESNLNNQSFMEIDGDAVATIADGLPNNIGCFGICSMNGSPCTPITARWFPGAVNVLAGNEPILTNNCKLTCAIGGIISVEDPGQTEVEAD